MAAAAPSPATVYVRARKIFKSDFLRLSRQHVRADVVPIHERLLCAGCCWQHHRQHQHSCYQSARHIPQDGTMISEACTPQLCSLRLQISLVAHIVARLKGL